MKPQNQLPEELYGYIKENCPDDMIKGVRKMCYWLKNIDKTILEGELKKGYLFLKLCNGVTIKCNSFGDLLTMKDQPINGQIEFKALFNIYKKDKLSREWRV